MAMNLASAYNEAIDKRFMSQSVHIPYDMLPPAAQRSLLRDDPMQPITYTSLRGWMFMNYSLLMLMYVVAGLVIYGLWRLL